MFAIASDRAVASDRTPRDALTRYFSKNGLTDPEMTLHGELLRAYREQQTTYGQALKASANVTFRKIEQTENTAVYAATISVNDESVDRYFYLVLHDERWKLRSMRGLAMTKLIYNFVKAVEAKGLEAVTSGLSSPEWAYRNSRLVVAPDDVLKLYFLDNESAFHELVGEVRGNCSLREVPRAQDLLIGDINCDEMGRVDLIIGGMMDNLVGYMYVPETAEVPRMGSEGYFILVEQIIGRWYLFKTS